jgi:C4-dicarboxylate transporter DctQ subunit
MLSRIIDKLEEGIISLLLASMTILVFVEVVLRFGFNTGLLWAEELTLLLSAWMVLFGASYGIKVGSHIGVDALVKNLPNKVARVVGAVSVLAALIYCGIYLKGSFVYLDKMIQIQLEMEDLPMQRWHAHSILVIGFTMIAIRLISLLWRIIKGEAQGFHQVSEAEESLTLADEIAKAREKEGELIQDGESK